MKARNIGINDVKIIDKECGTIGIKRDQIYDRFARESGRASRIEKYVLKDMVRDSYNEKKEDMLIID